MGLYNIATYGIDKYGEAPRLAFSVAPFIATAIPGVADEEYRTVQLRWGAPEGDISRVRLLRSQDGFPETEEDGLTLWSWSEESTLPRIEDFIDSPSTTEIPLISGRYAYYRIWIFRESTNTWLVAGDAVTIVPSPHDSLASDGTTLVSTHDKFMDALPRVFTSKNQSPLDVVDPSSPLYKFLKGFSFTLDEIMTLADNILPEESGASINPNLIVLKSINLGLEPEAYIATKNQKRLVREAVYMYTNKGTKAGIETYAESLTGFAPQVTSSPNLLLSLQDSSFYNGLGDWKVVGDAALTLEQTVVPVSDGVAPFAVDYAYTAKFVSENANASMRNGTVSPRTRGVPVSSESEYTLQVQVLADTGSGNTITPTIYWYDYLGALLSASTATGSSVTEDTWTKVSLTVTSPEEAAYAGIEFSVGTAGTTYFDMVQFAESSVTDYYEARAIDIFLQPKKTNEIKNPSFDPTQSAAWTIVAQDSEYVTPTTLTGGQFGDFMLRVDGTDAGLTSISANSGIVETGKYYTFSIYARMDGISVVNGQITDNVATLTLSSSTPWSAGQFVTVQSFEGKDVAGVDVPSVFNGTWEVLTAVGTTITLAIEAEDTALETADELARICRPETMTLRLNSYDELAEEGEEVSDIHESTYNFDNNWTRYSVTGFIAPNGNPLYLQASVYSETLGCIIDFDAAQLEASYTPTDYFDGDAPLSYGAVWEGTESNSRAHIYPNKAIKTTRLAETILDWVPINRAVTVRTFAGIEHKVV
jgi:hypothetical protein